MKNDIWSDTQPADHGDAGHDLFGPPAAGDDAARSQLLDAKVMMVDDEPLMTALIETHLEDAGYTNFVTCNNPLDALALLRREEPGVLLLDLMMPQMSGFELLEALRADRDLRYTPVIVLTASTGADAKLRALQLGATDFLSKPVDASELVLRVRNTLAFQQYTNRLANVDAATHLPNQRPFERGIDLMLRNEALAGAPLALLSLSVPECRVLRETLGEAAAGQLARTLGQRLLRVVEAACAPTESSTSPERAPRVARLGVDQFGIALEGLADADAVEAVAQAAARALAAPVRLGNHEVVPAAWIGVAMTPGDGQDMAALRKSAELACSHAKARATLPVLFASPELNRRSYDRMVLGSELRGAAARGELRLHYQPKLDLASGAIVGAEALVRWQHPVHGLLPPLRFIPLAEELGLITQLGQWVIEQGCRDLGAWSQAGLGQIKVAVNVAKPQFLAGNLNTVLRQALLDNGVNPAQLIIELTESMLMDDVSVAITLMQELKTLGVTLSIDDFGTGYSSLGYLKRLPLDELKIDRSFVMDLPGQASDQAIAQAVVQLGHSLGMSVIAEGVETEAQRACLQRLGCDQYQGFLFSRAVPAGDFAALLRKAQAADLPA